MGTCQNEIYRVGVVQKLVRINLMEHKVMPRRRRTFHRRHEIGIAHRRTHPLRSTRQLMRPIRPFQLPVKVFVLGDRKCFTCPERHTPASVRATIATLAATIPGWDYALRSTRQPTRPTKLKATNTLFDSGTSEIIS